MTRLDFVKLHGAGNDFVFVDLRADPGRMTRERARELCHRSFGIGADGVLVLTADGEGVPRMTIYNSDGSIPEMCGNGLRCFVKALVDHCGYTDEPLRVQTGAGVKTCAWRRHGRETVVNVSMGPVWAFDGQQRLSRGLEPERLDVDGTPVDVLLVSTGNPHAVVVGQHTREEMERLGPKLTRHPRFPQGANVGFLTRHTATRMSLTVHERGCGFTLACGTGAVAATASQVATGAAPAGERVRLALPGGELVVSVSQDFSQSVLEGPAVEVFSGTIE